MNSLDVFGRIEIIKAYILREFLIKNIDKLDITNILTSMKLKEEDFLHHNLQVKNGIATFFSVYEEIADLVELYDLSKSYNKQEDINKMYLEIVSIYQKKLNRPVNIEVFGEIKPYMQLRNLILLGDLSMNTDGFIVFDDKEYKKIVEDVVSGYKSDHKNKLDEILKTLKNGN